MKGSNMTKQDGKAPGEKIETDNNGLPFGYKMSRAVGEKIFENMCHELEIDEYIYKETDDGEDNRNKLIHAFCSGHLEVDGMIFTLKLKSPIKEIKVLTIEEPTAVQMRSMSVIKKKNDDFGKAMAVLGAVTGLGLPVMNELKGRDSMVAVAVISLFL